MTHPFVSDSHILHRAMSHRPEKVISASGVSLFLEDGREILDASAGPSVSCLGFGRPEIAEAVSNQINQLSYLYSGARFTCDATEELASLLLQGQPGGLSKAIFVNSGSEATDAAIKLATQYWHERGMPQKRHFIARKQSYHGNTIGALCVSGHDSRRAMYRDWLSSNVSFVDPCFSYRLKGNKETNDEYVKRLADQLEAEIFRIMCGMGKTGTMHAWEQENISGGYIPLSGVLLRSKIFDALADGSGLLAHGHTFQAHPVACAAALEVQRIIRDEDLLGNVARMGQVLEQLLKEEIGPLECVGDIRGRGLFWAVEFVQNRAAKTPFLADLRLCHQIVDKALDLGEVHVDHVIMAPPYVVTESELRRMVGMLREAIEAVNRQVCHTESARL
ncbi:hypothetical protein LCI18_006177 [Fusarium solani-melongenae]|uniref:Uncharacterized protein n=1 Tax=Fusarium solani subsp. cucurbitae TaxID=2747967 RepID=A0ACD3Z2A3_FUSSC|nr:hypothetical protein LCI18_006177 [Fusarium solani-melongenae]